MRIFVVDDEVDVAETLGDILGELGHEPSLVHTAEAALTALEREAPDAVLLDIYLPGMDGLEFLRRCRPRQRVAPVIGISGLTTEAQMWECLRLGALDFVRKPVTIELLAALVLYAEARQPGRDTAGGRGAERRRSARARMSIPVAVVEHGGSTWQSVAIDLSVFGMKLRPGLVAHPAEHVRLSFAPPDGKPGLELFAVLVREDPRGWAYRFVNLTAEQFERLQRLVAELAVRAGASSRATTPRAGRQSGMLGIVRWSGTDAASADYTLTFDSLRAGLHSRRCVTDNDLLGTLTALRVSREACIAAMMELATAGSASLHLSATEDELRRVGFTRS
jgi:DNA-binding response OmpR family regulator